MRLLSYITLFFLLSPPEVQAQATDHIAQAQEFFQARRYHEAVMACDRQLALYSRRDIAWFIRGKANMEKGAFSEAIDDFTQSLRYDRNKAETYALRAWCNFNMAEYKLARLDYIEACFLDTGNAIYHYNLANVEQHMHKLNEALKSYSLALRHDPLYVEAYKNRGHLNMILSNFEYAVKDFDSALKYEQNNPEILLYRGMCLISLKKFKEANIMFNRCIRLKERNAAAYFNRGLVSAGLRDHRNAVRDFDTALQFNPTMEIAFFNRAISKMELDPKKHGVACDDLRKAVEYGYPQALDYIKKYCE